MAYKNLVNQSVADSYEGFARFRDYLCKRNGTFDHSVDGVGWTLEDSQYAVDEDNPSNTDWIVVSSVGEGGSERLFYKIEIINNTYWKFLGYLSWNDVTHTGTCEYVGSYSIGNLNLMTSIWVYADLDFVTVVIDYAAGTGNCNAGAFGLIESPLDFGINPIPSAKAAGSDVEIVLIDSSKVIYDVDRYIFIYDGDDIERCLIKTNDTGTNTITVDLVNSYSAGAAARSYVPYMLDGAYSYLWYTSSGTRLLMGLNGTKNLTSTWAVLMTGPADVPISPGTQYQFPVNRGMWQLGLADVGDIVIAPWRYGLNYTSLNYFDLLEASDGTQWRYFKIVAHYWFFQEV